MNLTKLALKYDLTRPHFFILRVNAREKFDYVFSFDKDIEKSFKKFIEYVKGLVSKMEVILNSFTRGCDYGRKIVSLGLSETNYYTQLYNNDCQTIFKVREDKHYLSIELKSIRKWKKIIELEDEFLKGLK